MKAISIIPFIIISTLAAAQERQHEAAVAHEEKHAVTEFSVNYLRTAPDYESALETQELMGTVVEVIGQKGYWRQVTTPQPYTAWCTDLGLAYKPEEEIAEYIAAPKYIVTALYGHVFNRPSLESEHVCDLVAGDLLRIVFRGNTEHADGEKDKVSGHRKASVKGKWAEVMLPSGKTGFVPRKEVQEFMEWADSREATVENVIRTAKQFTGVPYLWGGMSSKGLDCSGLTRLVWLLNGVLLPRNASQQVHTGEDVPINPDPSFGAGSEGLREEMQRRVRNLQPGDLVFFGTPAAKPCNVSEGMPGAGGVSQAEAGGTAKDRITHVGIYIGDNRIIHSSHTVRINSLIPGDEDYYENAHRLIRARRVIGQEDCGKGIVSIINSPAYF